MTKRTGLTLELSYNGTGPVEVQVLDGLNYNPATGGFMYGIVPAALGFGIDLPALMAVDGTGTIQSIAIVTPNGWTAFGPTLNETPFSPASLAINQTSGNPGNTPSGNAGVGMIMSDPGEGGFWLCTVSYDPITPADAVWKFVASLGLTVNDGPLLQNGIIPLVSTKQPNVDRLLPISQPLPPMFGFDFPGTVNTGPALNNDSVPNQVTAGPDRNVWLADAAATTPGIWRIDQDGTGTLFPTDTGSTPTGLCFTASGYYWLTDPGRQSYWWPTGTIYGANTPTEVSLTGVDAGAQPGAVTTGPDGNAWAIDTRAGGGAGVWQLSINGGGTPASNYFPFGDVSTQLTDICAGPDGNLWVTDAAGFVWMVAADGAAKSSTFSGTGLPQAITTGPDGRLWVLSESGDSTYISAFYPTGGLTPSGLISGSGLPGKIIAGPGGDLWATDNLSNLYLIPTDHLISGSASPDLPVAFPLPGANAKYLCVRQDGTFVISQTQAAGVLWLTPFQMIVPQLLVTQGDVTFTQDNVGPTGPVIKDQSDGHTYRIISTAGVLSTQLVT